MFHENEKTTTTHQNLWDHSYSGIEREIYGSKTYTWKEENSQIDNISHQLKKLEKEK